MQMIFPKIAPIAFFPEGSPPSHISMFFENKRAVIRTERQQGINHAIEGLTVSNFFMENITPINPKRRDGPTLAPPQGATPLPL